MKPERECQTELSTAIAHLLGGQAIPSHDPAPTPASRRFAAIFRSTSFPCGVNRLRPMRKPTTAW